MGLVLYVLMDLEPELSYYSMFAALFEGWLVVVWVYCIFHLKVFNGVVNWRWLVLSVIHTVCLHYIVYLLTSCLVACAVLLLGG